ncbi:hypothetical protein PHYSODRAFT_520180 [Phytophthora sojae]|uniref:Uncharacterized protein n=1 Tax=Phytophthora sojae (strain P6497) TaxID=1094619 RepID=G5A1F4_PHYSP|nr:hypothetical protein PHYSODRAFT_520180 [Phytophthora sojae]EGZ10753.1 hypothetical protein PHYSODRAFT_520180 [Phytophthora sojae]|eukprot:XP_009533498.1 hypothetical protein PHYSODRAFT_520180 [Phytophthora sojae]
MADCAVTATDILALDIYSSADCEGAPDALVLWPSTDCTESGSIEYCEEAEEGYQAASCVSDPYAHTAEVFGDVPYVLVDVFNDTECGVYSGSFALRANGDCIVRGQTSVKVVMNTNGSATVEEYTGESCSAQDLIEGDLVEASWFDSYICADEGFVFYNNAYPGTSGSGSLAVAHSEGRHHFKSHLTTYLASLRM